MSMTTSGLNARRHAGKPMRQPLYRFDTIPKCKKDLEGSTIYEVTNRDDFVDSMAEMVYICKEAMRRANKPLNGKRTSKPLSLEYIADRLDIDDPLRGFFVRDNDSSRLQGYITFTTFTNWQKSFRWDSINESAFCWDDSELVEQMLNGRRNCDSGTLSVELQQTVRCGDVYNEGIVWPRIAEISLLGGLGCGKTLLSYTIELLETMKQGSVHNYDYVVLQATENSIPFYESMGFTRVGALTIDEDFDKKKAAKAQLADNETDTDESEADGVAVDTKPSPSSLTPPPELIEIVSNPNITYVVKKAGETPAGIAKKFGVSVWDIIFLNHYLYESLNARSWLYAGTTLYVPSKEDCKADAISLVRNKKDLQQCSKNIYHWYIAKENETPKSISRKFGLVCRDLVRANIERLPELLPVSRLKAGTRVRVSQLDQHDDRYIPYSHWTNPEDTGENIDPSYMMVRKLIRRRSNKRESVSSPLSQFVRPPSSLFKEITPPVKMPDENKQTNRVNTIEAPGKPRQPLTAYELFCNDRRNSLPQALAGKPPSEYNKVLDLEWKELDDEKKNFYRKNHTDANEKYTNDLKKYENNLIRFFEKHPEMRPKKVEENVENEGNLFNQVVTLKDGPKGELYGEFKYFYVLTYIPDLVWCHLAPMKQIGNWGDDKPECEGRPIWRLVDEDEGKEVDISAEFCTLVRSRQMYRTEDADDERWDMIESANCSETFKKKGEDRKGSIESFVVSTKVPTKSFAEVVKSGKRKVVEKQGPPSKRRKTIQKQRKVGKVDDTNCVDFKEAALPNKAPVSKDPSHFQASEAVQKFDKQIRGKSPSAGKKLPKSRPSPNGIPARKGSSTESVQNKPPEKTNIKRKTVKYPLPQGKKIQGRNSYVDETKDPNSQKAVKRVRLKARSRQITKVTKHAISQNNTTEHGHQIFESKQINQHSSAQHVASEVLSKQCN